jgi:hypothetical protein
MSVDHAKCGQHKQSSGNVTFQVLSGLLRVVTSGVGKVAS